MRSESAQAAGFTLFTWDEGWTWGWGGLESHNNRTNNLSDWETAPQSMEPNEGIQVPVKVHGWVARLRLRQIGPWPPLLREERGKKRLSRNCFCALLISLILDRSTWRLILHPSSLCGHCLHFCYLSFPPTNHLVDSCNGDCKWNCNFMIIWMQRAVVCRKQRTLKSHCKYLWLGLLFIWTNLGLHTGAAPHRGWAFMSACLF